MKVSVTIHLKNGVLDPQGKAVEGALHSLGFSGAKDVHVGKVITMTLPDNTSTDQIETMCEKLLANPVIEDYKITTNT
jgi:phosphoribosylformylglycinamidine synthase